MARFIIKLDNYYLEWSTGVDAPVTYGGTRAEMREYLLAEYAKKAEQEIDERLVRCDVTGTSAYGYGNVDELIKNNRAGKDEQTLTREEIIQHFCLNRPT